MGLPGMKVKGCYFFMASTKKVKQYRRDIVMAQLFLFFAKDPHKKQFMEYLNKCVKDNLPIEFQYHTVDTLTDTEPAIRTFCDWIRINYQITNLAIAINQTFFVRNGEVMEEDPTDRSPSLIIVYFHVEKEGNLLSKMFNR